MVPVSKAWPGFVMMLVSSKAVLLLGLVISPLGSLIDCDIARNKVADVYLPLGMATRENDFATRGMRIIDGLQRMHTNKLIGTPIVNIKSRLGASVFWSFLLMFKRFQLGGRMTTIEGSSLPAWELLPTNLPVSTTTQSLHWKESKTGTSGRL
jgi:hypothetical protein